MSSETGDAAGPEVEAVEGGLDEPTELEPDQGTLALVQPGDEHTREEWEAATAAVLRKSRRLGDDDADALVWDRLTRTTLDGIAVAPLYVGDPDDLEDQPTGHPRPTRDGEWDVRAHLAGDDAKRLRDEALVDLEGGVTSLWLEVPAGIDWSTLLDGVLLDLAPVVLCSPDDPERAARAFLQHLGDTEPAPGTHLGFDARTATAEQAALALDAGVLGFVVDATAVHDRGASDAQELGWSLAVAASCLRTLTEAGVELDRAVSLLEFRYAATDDQFATIAKLRAARVCWERMLLLCEASPAAQRQHAVTGRPMMSRYDPYVNMLRTTVAAFAAGAGGAESVTVEPFDTPLGRPEVLGRRIARNTSALLISESHVARVTDPAGGSYAVERLTDDLAVAGWDVLGRIEGGESLDDAIAATVAARDELVATRTRPITGLTEFPALGEERPRRATDPLAPDVRRYGAAFEALRDEPAAEPVFLATLGPVAAHTARATFATNLLAAGGIAVDVAGATDGVEALVAAHAGQAVVCLAGSDATYGEWGSDAAAALREAGATHVVIAGKPVPYADDSCAMGVDALDFLTRTREAL